MTEHVDPSIPCMSIKKSNNKSNLLHKVLGRVPINLSELIQKHDYILYEIKVHRAYEISLDNKHERNYQFSYHERKRHTRQVHD